MTEFLREVETELKAMAKKQKPSKWQPEDYIGGGASALTYLNLKVPDVRALAKRGFSFQAFPVEKQWTIWNYIWQKSMLFEAMSLAAYWVKARPIDEIFKHRELLFKWLERVDNWGHSDELSGLYSMILEQDHDKHLPLFRKWNASKKPWYKRQSIVGLMFYSRFRKKHVPAATLLDFIENHIDDDHYYVQKGVGWALRECWNVYPDVTFRYLKKNAARIPSAGWTAATEKLSPADKAILTNLRKSGRTSSQSKSR